MYKICQDGDTYLLPLKKEIRVKENIKNEGDMINESVLKDLIRDAVDYNIAKNVTCITEI